MENWRPIPGYDGRYEASDQGRIRSMVQPGRWGKRRDAPLVMTPHLNPRGYFIVNIGTSRADRRQRTVHQLVLETFVGPKPDGYYGCHADDVKTNNTLSNLRWDTPKANYDEAWTNGRHPSTESRLEAARLGRDARRLRSRP